MFGLWQILTLLSGFGVFVYKLYFSVFSLPSVVTLEWLCYSDCILVSYRHWCLKMGLVWMFSASPKFGRLNCCADTHTQIQTVSIYTSILPVCWWVIRLLWYSPAACNGHFCGNKKHSYILRVVLRENVSASLKNPRQHCCFHFLQCIITHFCSHLFPFANVQKRRIKHMACSFVGIIHYGKLNDPDP